MGARGADLMEDAKAEPAQIDKFRELARELEADDDEARFDERLKKLATAPPKPKPDSAHPKKKP
jgi:hypothetical protein